MLSGLAKCVLLVGWLYLEKKSAQPHRASNARTGKMRHLAGVIVLGLALMYGSAQAVGSEAAKMYGAGAQTCGTWTERRADDEAAIYESWVLGFLSYMNIFLEQGTGGLVVNITGATEQSVGTVDDGLFAWIDNYCAAHPLGMVAEASLFLGVFLMEGRAAPN